MGYKGAELKGLKLFSLAVVIVDSVYDSRVFENHNLLNVGGKYIS
jgi:hypothetical protein